MRAMWTWLLLALVVPPQSAAAGALEELLAQQRNGLWEVRSSGSLIQLAQTAARGERIDVQYICVTDQQKIDAGREVRSIIADGYCQPQHEEFHDGRLAASAACNVPGVGQAQIDQNGWSQPGAFHVETQVSAAALSILGQNLGAVTDGRWLRACAPHEQPGLQPSP